MLAKNAQFVNPETGKNVKVYRTFNSCDGSGEIAVVALKDYEALTGVRLCTNHTGKMEGVQSANTSVQLNRLCALHAQTVNQDGEKAVCASCYANTLSEVYPRLAEKNAANDPILKGAVLHVVPMLSTLFFRFEAFGDLETKTQVINYFNIAKGNPAVHCALWTKNPYYISRALKAGAVKPKNLNIGLSSLFLNTPAVFKMYEYFTDFIFTVYTADHLDAHRDIKINCGGLSCLACGRCYTYDKARNGHGEIMIVNELLKQDKSKAKKLGIEAFYD